MKEVLFKLAVLEKTSFLVLERYFLVLGASNTAFG